MDYSTARNNSPVKYFRLYGICQHDMSNTCMWQKNNNAGINEMPHSPPPSWDRVGISRVLCQKAPPQGWGIFSLRTCDPYITWWFSMAEKKVLLCLIKRKYRCPTWGFRSIQGDSPKNLAPGVRLYTIDFGKSPPIPGRGGVGHFIDTRISYSYSCKRWF